MKISKILGGMVVLSVLCLNSVTTVMAAVTPTLFLSSNGSNVQIYVTGDSNAVVQLFHYPQGASIPSSLTIGRTNGDGNFSLVTSMSAYGIVGGESTFVTIAGLQSAIQAWPSSFNNNFYYNNNFDYYNGNLSLSLTSVNLKPGQSIFISTSNGSGLYLSSNSNSAAVSANVSNNQLMLVGVGGGSATVAVCSINVGCNSVYVGVQNFNNSGLSFDQNSVSLSIGQSVTINTSNGSDIFVSKNTNYTIASASINSNQLRVTGVSTGSATITVCSSNVGCSNVLVNVNKELVRAQPKRRSFKGKFFGKNTTTGRGHPFMNNNDIQFHFDGQGNNFGSGYYGGNWNSPL